MRVPKLRVGNIDDAAPKIGLGQMLLPIAEMLAIERRKLRRHPGFCMDAVRDVGNWHFVDRNTGPHIFPKRSCHFTVQFADGVCVSAETKR